MAGTTDPDILYEPCVLCSDIRFWTTEGLSMSTEGCPVCGGLGAVVHECEEGE